MEFFDKKQDVLDIKITSYGKQLLSRGLFKPVYYAFSDDGVMYDVKWMSGTLAQEKQSESEPRIQEGTPRLKTQYRKIGAERGIYNFPVAGDALYSNLPNLSDLFEMNADLKAAYSEKLFEMLVALHGSNQLHARFAESEKLLENVLGTKSYFNGYNPAWNMLFYNGTISGSTGYYKKNDITTLTPQLNCTLTDTVYKMFDDLNPFEALPEVKNIASSLANAGSDLEGDSEDSLGIDIDNYETYFQQFYLEDGILFLIKDFLFLSVEEANTEFTNDNFIVEVFEVTTTTNDDDGEESLRKLSFTSDKIPLIIEVDDEINSQLACSLIGKDKPLKDQSIYTTNVFDCNTSEPDSTISIDPYENLPKVDTGEVC